MYHNLRSINSFGIVRQCQKNKIESSKQLVWQPTLANWPGLASVGYHTNGQTNDWEYGRTNENNLKKSRFE